MHRTDFYWNVIYHGRIRFFLFVFFHITLPPYHRYEYLSEDIELQKCLSDICCLECVSKIRSVLSIIFHVIYGAVCIQLAHFSFDDCENTCTLSFYHHQIGSMTHLPLHRGRSWNNGMRCMSFYISMGCLCQPNAALFHINRALMFIFNGNISIDIPSFSWRRLQNIG